MSAPWAPPRRPERPRGAEPALEAETLLAGVMARLEAAEAELGRLEREAAPPRGRWWLAVIAGLVLALVLL